MRELWLISVKKKSLLLLLRKARQIVRNVVSKHRVILVNGLMKMAIASNGTFHAFISQKRRIDHELFVRNN